MEVVFGIIGFIFEVAFRALGLWVLKLLTFGRYKDTNSYLHFLPSFVGFVFLIVLIVLLVFGVSGIRWVMGL